MEVDLIFDVVLRTVVLERYVSHPHARELGGVFSGACDGGCSGGSWGSGRWSYRREQRVRRGDYDAKENVVSMLNNK